MTALCIMQRERIDLGLIGLHAAGRSADRLQYLETASLWSAGARRSHARCSRLLPARFDVFLYVRAGLGVRASIMNECIHHE